MLGLDIPATILIVAFCVTAFGATVQGTIGLGFAILTVPVLSMINPALAPVPQALIVSILTGSMAYRERHAIELKGVAWVLFGRIPGALLGVGLLKLASTQVLDMIIGGVVLVAVLVLSTRLKIPRNRFTEVLAGVVSGASALVSSIGGPPLALLYRDAKGPTIRANLATIFSVGLLLTITARAVSGEISSTDLKISVLLAPAMLIGLLVSRRLTGRVEGRALKISVLTISALAAAGLIGRAMLQR